MDEEPHAPQAAPTGTIFQPEVAADAIVFAAEHPERKSVLLGYPTVESTLGEKLIPGTLDHYLAHAAWEGAQLPERADPNQPDNFWQPLPGDRGSHGPFDDKAWSHSPQLWATRHRTSLLAALAGVSAAAVAMTFGRGRNGHHS